MDYLNSVMDLAEAKNRTEVLYLDPTDGLLHCPVCRQKRQTILPIGGRTVYCICTCEETKRAEARERLLQQQREDLRKHCFDGAAGRLTATFRQDDRARPEVSDLCRGYADNFDKLRHSPMNGILMLGGVGTGKSYLAAAIANRLIDTDHRVAWLTVSRVGNLLMDAERRREQLYAWTHRYDLLILDDLGAERSTEFAQECLWQFVDAVSSAHIPLIVTTNLSWDELSKPLDLNRKRIYDRLIELCRPVRLEGSSRRRKAAPENWSAFDRTVGLPQ